MVLIDKSTKRYLKAFVMTVLNLPNLNAMVMLINKNRVTTKNRLIHC